MGGEPPYLYQRPSAHSFVNPNDRPYNPKAASHASWAPSQPRPKPTGPLIDSKEMNRHPDSYFIVPYGNLASKPMSPRTKAMVKWTRLLQLFLRICALLGAAGLLFCVIAIKPSGNTSDWAMRVPPAIGVLHNIYAIYHLSRSSRGRTPASSASYHIFAAIVDACIVPVLAYTAYLAHQEHAVPIDPEWHWKTMFDTEAADYAIIYATWLIAVTVGGLHIVSFCISIVLAVIFRKIANLPPDMNPLEDNLTARPHKRNKSSMSMAVSESTISNRDSHLSAPLIDSPTNRPVPFMHTRNDSASSFGSPERRSLPPRGYNRASRTAYQPAPQRESQDIYRAETNASDFMHSRQASKPTSRPVSAYSSPSRSPQRESLLKEPAGENWFVHASSPPSSPERDDAPFNENPPELQHLRFNKQHKRAGSELSQKYDYTGRSPRPLEMNPPTPPVNNTFQQRREQFEQRALQATGGNNGPVGGSGTWEEPNYRSVQGNDNGNNGGKGRFYGALKDSLRVSRRGQRVVSSGVDTGDLGTGQGLRGREVSGKVAEEGRVW